MKKPPAPVERFLTARRVALVGASTDPQHFSRAVLEAWVKAGYEVLPVNPKGGLIAGIPAAPRLGSIEPPPDAALIMVPASEALRVVAEAIEAGVTRVWLHRGAGPGSVSPEAVAAGRGAGLDLVVGECPLMFVPGTGFIHRVHRFFHRPASSETGATA